MKHRAGRELIKSVGSIIWKTKKYYTDSNRGISYIL